MAGRDSVISRANRNSKSLGLLAFEDYLRGRVLGRVGNREMDSCGAHFVNHFGRFSFKAKLRGSQFVVCNFDVGPRDFAAEPGFQRL